MKRYVIDPMHSDIEFKIKHLMISTVKGRFNLYDAWMESHKEDFSDAKITCVIRTESIYTSIKDRDDHLRSADFFDVEKFPTMEFRSTSVQAGKDGTYTVDGRMTIKGVTKPLRLKGTFNGSDVDHYDQTKYGFELEGKLSRSEWDLDFNVAGGKNTLLIGDEVKLDISIQMIEDDV